MKFLTTITFSMNVEADALDDAENQAELIADAMYDAPGVGHPAVTITVEEA